MHSATSLIIVLAVLSVIAGTTIAFLLGGMLKRKESLLKIILKVGLFIVGFAIIVGAVVFVVLHHNL